MYNFMDFNCHRCIEIFALAGLLTGRPGRKPQRTFISDLVPTIKTVVERMNPAVEDIRDSLAKLDEVELRRRFRNLLAHCAARRIPNEDAIVLFSMDGFDQKQISGVDNPLEDVAQTSSFPSFWYRFVETKESEMRFELSEKTPVYASRVRRVSRPGSALRSVGD